MSAPCPLNAVRERLCPELQFETGYHSIYFDLIGAADPISQIIIRQARSADNGHIAGSYASTQLQILSRSSGIVVFVYFYVTISRVEDKRCRLPPSPCS